MMRKIRLISDQKAMQPQGSLWTKQSAFLADQMHAARYPMAFGLHSEQKIYKVLRTSLLASRIPLRNDQVGAQVLFLRLRIAKKPPILKRSGISTEVSARLTA